MLPGRLGLETARIPHADRHGLLYLERGRLYTDDGCLRFDSAGGPALDHGVYTIAHQSISLLMLGPGGSVTQDALRILARHGTGLIAVGEDGVRCYSAPPLLPDSSALARRQVKLWMDERRGRPLVVRRMYARRMGIIMPHRDITVLRGIEGARVKSLYARLATKYGIEWHGRVYDRMDPGASDDANQALNHAASAVEGAAAIAVYATATIPQLGFVHEDSGQSFVLDIADLYRDRVTVPCAFRAVAEAHRHPHMTFERVVRKLTGATLRKEAVIASMIDDIKALFAEAERPEHPASSQTPNDEGAITRDSSDDDLQSEPA